MPRGCTGRGLDSVERESERETLDVSVRKPCLDSRLLRSESRFGCAVTFYPMLQWYMTKNQTLPPSLEGDPRR